MMKKINQNIVRSILMMMALVCSLSLTSQNILLTVDLTLDPPEDCQLITTGDVLTFERSLDMVIGCSPDVIILHDGELTPVFTTSDLIFSYDFPAAGEYVIFCGAPNLPEAAGSAVCFTVIDSIPTMGEWGIIVLTLLLLILSVIVIQTNEAGDQVSLMNNKK